MKKILITGATGNVGVEVIKSLLSQTKSNKIIAAVREPEKARMNLNDTALEFVKFNFEDASTFDKAFKNIDSIFLLRPPHISDVDKYFKPLISKAAEKGIREIIFLSVQGAEKSKVIPHNKIERLIKNSGMDYIFLRPGYFMQNLTTTLHKDIVDKRQIILPAGKAKFNLIDVKDIGETAALVLSDFSRYKNRAFDLTGYENKSFYEVTDIINTHIPDKISYRNVNPLHFYFIKKKSGMKAGMIMVMIMLHFLPRFQKDPEISTFFEDISGKKPATLEEFIEREKARFDTTERKNSKSQKTKNK